METVGDPSGPQKSPLMTGGETDARRMKGPEKTWFRPWILARPLRMKHRVFCHFQAAEAANSDAASPGE